MAQRITWFAIATGLGLFALGCGKGSSKLSKDAGDQGPIATAEDDTGTVTAVVKASEGGELDFSSAKNEAVKNTTVSIPPGALAVDTQIEVKEVTPIVNTATAAALQIDTASPAGPSVAVEAQDMNALTGSLVIGLPYTPSASLTQEVSYIVIGVYSQGTNSVVETFVGDELTFVGGKIGKDVFYKM